MLQRIPWRLDLAAFSLLAAGLGVAVALLSHEPTGPAYPPPASSNLLGTPGAILAQGLFDALGMAVFALLGGWFVLVVLMFLRKSWVRWTGRLLGWTVLVPCVAVVADLLTADRNGGVSIGGGGSLGAWLAAQLALSMPPAGQVALIAGAVAVGLWLAIAPVLRQFGFALGRALRAVFVTAYRMIPARKPRPPRPKVVPKARPAVIPRTAPEPARPARVSNPGDIPINHHHHVASDGGADRFASYELPALNLLEDAEPVTYDAHDEQLRDRAVLLEKTFTDFGLNVKVVGINTGPVVTQFEMRLETGLRVSKVTRLAEDVALNLKVPSVRFVAPIPGKDTVGVEVPNDQRAVVRLKEVMLAAGKKVGQMKLPLFLGKDSEGRPLIPDLAEMPHLLIAGTTGTGKSVCMNAIILSMLMTRRPDELKMVMIDPKGGVEMRVYDTLPHLMHPVVSDVNKAEAILAWAVDKMEERYALLNRARVRNIASYNALPAAEIRKRVVPEDGEEVPVRLPYVVVIIDEMSDLILQKKKEVEGHIIRLSQKSRAAGIHLVVATQKPTVDVITGLIKSNLPSRVCFKVTNKSDSRVVLDEMGADKLLGKGDMLFLPPGTSNLLRAQGTFASDQEIEKVVDVLGGEPCYAEELMTLQSVTKSGPGELKERLRDRDELYEAAIEVILREGRGSVSLLQRAMGIGYGRAARLIDFMAEDGIVGAYKGSNAREVLYTPEQWQTLKESA